MHRRLQQTLLFLLLLMVVVPSRRGLRAAGDSLQGVPESDVAAEAATILAQMDTAERVGQLFLVTFPGTATGENNAITDLVLRQKVGGVILLAENDNLVGEGNLLLDNVAQLSNSLQRIALLGEAGIEREDGIEEEATLPTNTPVPPATAIPLLIATQQEGNGAPFSQIHSGLTPLPSAMAIGATWQPHYARESGATVGSELKALGINMLFGPSLDVLENPDPANASDLGVRSFGGDPYWVGLMGRAFTSGVHQGGEGRVAVVAKHFPGRGSSDRPLAEEVSTVRKSLEQLKQVELAPFFTVTADVPGEGSATDGLLVTHIRYQGFQGNLRDTTAPVSFDPAALQTLLGLPEVNGWREAGGITVSDALGVRAVQRFYDSSELEFPHRRVAKDALLAGNDLLYIDDFALQPATFEAELANLNDTIAWFQERYESDPAFRQRIDDAAMRIIALKLRLYDSDFSIDNVLVPIEDVAGDVGQDDPAMLRLARSAVTLISPSASELQERIPSPPGPEDQIVVFTDVRWGQQCSDCLPEPYINVNSLEERILALYGPGGSEQMRPEQISSFAYSDLQEFLAAGSGPIPPPTPIPTPPEGTPTPEVGATAAPSYSPAFQVQSALQSAEWVVFVMLDVTDQNPSSTALKGFLAKRPDMLRDRRTIVFAYDAPYFLDTTEISKLTAYYALYSKNPAFIDASARTLFQELPATGASPVDVAGIDYRLLEVTEPDPRQVIDLFVVRDGALQSPPSEEPLELVVGDTLNLRTGVISDHNGNPVPDGTPVQFIQQDRLEGFVSLIGESPTEDGVAELDYVLEARTGQFRITAAAGSATNSQQLDIAIGENVRVVLVTLTPAPTPTSTPTSTATATPTPSATPTPTSIPSPTAAPSEPAEPLLEIPLSNFVMLLGALGGLTLTALLAFVLFSLEGGADVTGGIRLVSWGFLGGLILYNYFILDLPGMDLLHEMGAWGALLATTSGGLIGLLFGWLQFRGNIPGLR